MMRWPQPPQVVSMCFRLFLFGDARNRWCRLSTSSFVRHFLHTATMVRASPGNLTTFSLTMNALAAGSKRFSQRVQCPDRLEYSVAEPMVTMSTTTKRRLRCCKRPLRLRPIDEESRFVRSSSKALGPSGRGYNPKLSLIRAITLNVQRIGSFPSQGDPSRWPMGCLCGIYRQGQTPGMSGADRADHSRNSHRV